MKRGKREKSEEEGRKGKVKRGESEEREEGRVR
jgi:hypothetical protein